MTELSKTILEAYQVRKTRKQKNRFICLMQENFPELQIEKGGFPQSRNLILGDVEKAEILLTAHYDTCTAMPVPNFLAPKNILLSIGYALLIAIPFFFIAVLINVACRFIFNSAFLQSAVYLLCFFSLFYFSFIGGIPNRNNANDNTSGIILLLELFAGLSPEEKARCAFVFFDNEELGLIGSSFYRRKHRKASNRQLILNFDCISDGEYILLVRNASAKKSFDKQLRSAFADLGGKTALHASSLTTMYPSDQAHFPCSVGIAAVHKKPFVGPYLSRIHTYRDTVFDESNIAYLYDATKKFLALTEVT